MELVVSNDQYVNDAKAMFACLMTLWALCRIRTESPKAFAMSFYNVKPSYSRMRSPWPTGDWVSKCAFALLLSLASRQPMHDGKDVVADIDLCGLSAGEEDSLHLDRSSG